MNESKRNLCALTKELLKKKSIGRFKDFIKVAYEGDSISFSTFLHKECEVVKNRVYDSLCDRSHGKIDFFESISREEYDDFIASETSEVKFKVGKKYLYDGLLGRFVIEIVGEYTGDPVVIDPKTNTPFVCAKRSLTNVNDVDIAIIGMAREFGITEELADEIHHSNWVKGTKS